MPSVLLSAWPLALLSTFSLAPLSALHVVLPGILSPVLPSASFAYMSMLKVSTMGCVYINAFELCFDDRTGSGRMPSHCLVLSY